MKPWMKIYLDFCGKDFDEDAFREAFRFEGEIEKRVNRLGEAHYRCCENLEYDPYVSVMIREALGELFKRPNALAAFLAERRVKATLHIVPHLADGDSESVNPCLNLDDDIIAWLFLSRCSMDLDYYVDAD